MDAAKKQKLNSKDLIVTAIFSVLFAVLIFIGSMTVGMTPITYPFMVAVVLVPCGIIWVYLRVKVPKAGGTTIQSVVLALLLFIIGAGWWIAVSLIIGGLLAELISRTGGYVNFKINTLAYMVFGVVLNLGSFSPILFAARYYYDYCMTNGMDTEYMNTLMHFMSWPVMGLTSALSLLGAFIGMQLGNKMMNKHFKKAGIA